MTVKIKNDGTILISKIVVGTPIRTIQQAGIPGVNANGAQTGDILVYNATTKLWEPQEPTPVTELNFTVDAGEY